MWSKSGLFSSTRLIAARLVASGAAHGLPTAGVLVVALAHVSSLALALAVSSTNSLALVGGLAAAAVPGLVIAQGASLPALGLALSAAASCLKSALSAFVGSGFSGALAPASASGSAPANSLDRDVDFFSSTDFEDLLVFTLDALELLWQDVNLLVELCGDNALGLGFLGLSWASRRVFSAKRLKR